MRNSPFHTLLCTVALVFVAIAAPHMAAQTAVSTTLATFGAGSEPVSSLIQARDGNLYGVTSTGGSNSSGTIYQLSSSGQLTTIYNFTGGATDGGSPATGLVEASDGALYGTTTLGGASDLGTVFRISGTTLTTLHSFDPNADGNSPYAALTVASDGNLYGILAQGPFNPGTGNYSGGTIFTIHPDGTYTNLYAFPEDDSLGSFATARLLQASDGNLWGVTSSGGTNSDGTLFSWSASNGLTVLHNFSAVEGSPLYGLAQWGTSLYGVTFPFASGEGEIFSLAISGHAYNIVYSFTGSIDGGLPATGFYPASDGNLYGTTQSGGAFSNGTFFRLSFGQPITLFNFPAGTLNTYADAALLEGADTNFYLPLLYDTTPNLSPMDGAGTLIQLAPPYNVAPPPPVLLTASRSTVALNQNFSLTWSLPDSASLTSQQCVAFSGSSNPASTPSWSGVVPASGNQILSLTALGTYTFTLNCGGSQNSIIQVTVSDLTSTKLSAPAKLSQGQTATLSATVTTAGGAIATGNVQFVVDGSIHLAAITLVNGTASFSASTSGVPVGSYSVQAIYSGDANNAPSSSTTSTVVLTPLVKQSTTITFTASPQHVNPGKNITFTATVSSKSGTPGGTVSLLYGTILLATGTLKSGVAAITVSSAGAPAGLYSLHMTYAGSADYLPSSSPVLYVTVN